MIVMFQDGGPDLVLLSTWDEGPGFSVLLLAVAFFGIAVFLLQKSAAFQLLAASSNESAPKSGSPIAWATVLIITLLWLLRWYFVELEGGQKIFIALLHDIFATPMEFALLVFVASIPLASLALFNFFASYRVGLRNRVEGGGQLEAASGAATLYTAVQLLGSIASILSLALM